ncbi:ParB N-terminal domain-containing protein [Tyzzerella sp. OttesenSCG-928-J15]|nr:ParB N-terminal domain-containing protein [Tyzzerella sp. OttesenSCG-928-J15]
MKNNRDIKLKSYDDIFNIKGNYSENEVTLINVNMLVDFRDHPFKVIANKDMEDLFESILLNGILVPIFVRPLGDRYEIISGHRRKYCATKAGLKQVPCIVKEGLICLRTLFMVTSNCSSPFIGKYWA